MSVEFVCVVVRLTGGELESVRLPPGYKIRRTTAGWFAYHPDGWRSPHVALGSIASEDRASAWQVANHAFNRYLFSDAEPDEPSSDDRPPAMVGEIVCPDDY